MKQGWIAMGLALAVAGCDSPPTGADVDNAFKALAPSTTIFKDATDLSVSDTYCSQSNDAYACTATAVASNGRYKVQMLMRKEGGDWKAEMLTDPTPLS